MTPRPDAIEGYRRGVGLMMFNPAGLVWVGRRIDRSGEAWQMPQGGIDAGETPGEAALRELKEETGTDKAAIVAESAGWLRYDLPSAVRDRVWGGRFRGQTQKWFLLRFTGADDDIDIAADAPEFDAWRWMPVDDLATHIVAFKRELYRQVTAEFGALITGETGAPSGSTP